MSISLSVFFTEPLIIEVASFSMHTNKIFNFLLGREGGNLNISIQNSDGMNIKKIEPNLDEVYKFVETNMMCSGGYILYAPDELWEYHSDREIYEFCITEINFDYGNALFAMELSMLIAVAQYSKVGFINDIHGVFIETKEDSVNVNDILNLRLAPNCGDIKEALGLFYNKLKI